MQAWSGPLVGRTRELDEVAALLGQAEVQLVTLTGPGGVGKTRLAVALSQSLASRFRDGAVVVDLVTVAEPALVPSAVASALELREDGGRGSAEALRLALEQRELLVVLDNFEHVLAAAEEIAGVLDARSASKLLVTSREPLGLLAEREYPVAPLALPTAAHLNGDHNLLGDVPAVELLLQRARAVRPDFAVTPANAHAIADLVRRLDGLPLALELAASRLRALTPEALLLRLGESLDLLQSRERDRPERHRTLRAAVSWSYQQLEADERRVFRALGVFAGPATLDAIEATLGTAAVEDGVDVLGAVESLLEKGLLARDDGSSSASPDGEPRFRLLETMRDYALELLRAEGELEDARARHADYFASLAARAAAELNGRDQVAWFARVRQEWGNFEAALTWAVEREDADLAVRVASMTPYWWRRGLMSEGRRWLDLVLELLREPASNPATTAAALRITISAGFLSGASGDVANGLRLIERGVAIAREVGDAGALAQAMAFRAWLGWLLDRPEWTDEVAAETAALEDSADAWSMGFCLTILGVWMTTQGRFEDGLARLERAVPLLEVSDEIVGRSVAEVGIAVARGGLGDATSALAHAERSLRMLRESGDVQALPTVVEGALMVSWKCAPPSSTTEVHAARARVMGGIERVRETAGVFRAPNWRADWDALLGQTRAGLGVEAFMDAYASSPEVSPLEVIDDALRLFTGRSGAGEMPAGPTAPMLASSSSVAGVASTAALLTSREREVALLIARGFTSRQIADRLVISERTADTHAGHIREKLGLHSRAEIAAWAAREGLGPFEGALPPERGA